MLRQQKPREAQGVESCSVQSLKPPSLTQVLTDLDLVLQKRERWTTQGERAYARVLGHKGPVWVGSALALHDESWIRNLKVDLVCTCCPMDSRSEEGIRMRQQLESLKGKYDVQCLSLEVPDAPFYPILRLLPQVEEFLRQKKKNSSCVVHCRAGINRSVAIFVALLMKSVYKARESMSSAAASPEALLEYCWRQVSERRGRPILTNPGFQRQLCMYAHLLFMTDAKGTWPLRP